MKLETTIWMGLALTLGACGTSPTLEVDVEPQPKEEVAAAPEATGGIPERKDDADRASKNGLTKGTVGGVDVVVTYGRPQVKGRTIFGDLVPYGKVWRTGADEATTLTLSTDAKLNDVDVKAGTYGLFTVPGEKEWSIVLNSVAVQWGSYDYDESKDVVRFAATPEKADAAEELTISAEGDKLWVHWAETRVPIVIAKN